MFKKFKPHVQTQGGFKRTTSMSPQVLTQGFAMHYFKPILKPKGKNEPLLLKRGKGGCARKMLELSNHSNSVEAS